MECIDQWLSSRKPLCPICKWDALEEFLEGGEPRDVEAGEPEADSPASSPVAVQPESRLRYSYAYDTVQHFGGSTNILGCFGGVKSSVCSVHGLMTTQCEYHLVGVFLLCVAQTPASRVSENKLEI